MADFALQWVVVAGLVASCSQVAIPDAGSPVADTGLIDVRTDAPVPRTDAPVDATPCGDAAACGPAQVCVHFDGSRLGPQSVCMDLPASCGTTPSCSCPDLPGCHGPSTTCMTCDVTGRDVSCGCPCC